MTSKDTEHLPKLRDRTACYKDGRMLIIHEHENDNAWIAGEPITVRQ